MAQLIDSSVLIALERRGLRLDELARVTPDSDAALSTVTASELLVGVHRSDSPERRRLREEFVEGVLSSLPIFPFELLAARTHALLSAQLAAAGVKIDSHDLIIGATALTLGYSVLTDNLRDFERIAGLVVRRPAWPQ